MATNPRSAGNGGKDAARPPIVRPQRERLADIIYGQMLEHIVAGHFPIGSRLPAENEFAEMYAVSRPVIREVLLRLQADGVVLARQGSGTYVRRRPPRRLIEITGSSEIADILRCFEARMALESETARFAAMRRSEDEVDQLQVTMKELRHEFNSGSVRPEVDFAFHRLIASISNNQYLLGMFDFLTASITEGIGVTLGFTRKGSAERAQRVLDEHERIFDAIIDSDGESAALAMRYHLDQARKRLMDGSREY